MTTLNTKAIWKRAEKATPGPWETSVSGTSTVEEAAEHTRKLVLAGSGGAIYGVWCPEHPATIIGDDRTRPVHAVQSCTTGNGPNSEANSEFIAAARTDVPALCDALDESRAEAAQLRQEREMLRTVLAQIVNAIDNDTGDADLTAGRAALAATETKT